MTLALNEKLQSLLVAVGAAKSEESKKLTDEKLRTIQDDLQKWAADFAQARPARRQEVEEARSAALQKEFRISAQVSPFYSFAIRFIEETIRAYVSKIGEKQGVEAPKLPDNLYVPDAYVNVPINFRDGARWEITIDAQRPAREDIPPSMTIRFASGMGNFGRARFRVFVLQQKLTIDLDGNLPDPAPYQGFVECELPAYEGTVRTLLQKQIEAQLLSSPGAEKN